MTPGIYFAINSPGAVVGTEPAQVAATISDWGFLVTPEMITGLADDVGEETIISRTGGAPTFAIGMAHIFSQVIGGASLMAFWYHFAILFEALKMPPTRIGRQVISTPSSLASGWMLWKAR